MSAEDWSDYYDDQLEVLIGIKVIHETANAYLIQKHNSQAWFPRSISYIDEDTIEYNSDFSPSWIQLYKFKEIEGDFV